MIIKYIKLVLPIIFIDYFSFYLYSSILKASMVSSLIFSKLTAILFFIMIYIYFNKKSIKLAVNFIIIIFINFILIVIFEKFINLNTIEILYKLILDVITSLITIYFTNKFVFTKL